MRKEKQEENHEHYFRVIAYFYAENDDEEWIVLQCGENCGCIKVVEGISVRE